ncbi:transmembrane protein 179B [Gadus morhua]|uniref:transmembrane protein 179B n=1 Tax=Gadus morhua TaxID=8049 RepID=UPI0011B36DA8|nr:transmembrane protein 179B [Gadus morhua]
MTLSCLMAAELALYASCFVCGIVTAASLAITQGNLGGLCMLYGTVDFNNLTQTITATVSSPASLCYFVSAISVIVAVTCFTLSLYWLYSCCIDGSMQRTRVWTTLTLGLCGVFLFFLLISGCILKIGRDSLCSSIVKAVDKITSCEQAQGATWATAFDGHQFYIRLHNAETAVWVNFFLWIIAGGLLVFQICLDRSPTAVEGFGGGAGSGFGGGAGGGSAGENKPLFSHEPSQNNHHTPTGDFYD